MSRKHKKEPEKGELPAVESRRESWKIQIYNTLSISQGERKNKMVNVTMKGIFEGGETVTKTMEPCDMVFIVGIRNEDDSHTACQQVVMGGKGLKTAEAVNALADSTVEFLIKLSADSRRKQAMTLAAYLERFADYAADKNRRNYKNDIKKTK